jgi:hypothetical protein
MRILKSIPFIKHYLAGKHLPNNPFYLAGKKLLNDQFYQDGLDKGTIEHQKKPKRTCIINLLLSGRKGKTHYLEIGIRNPADNYNDISADEKYSVDPGSDLEENPADYKMTSDEFFELLSNGTILSPRIRFDVIFIDGLHLAEQVDRDITHSLKFAKDDGFVVLHDCNPPTEWHARENYHYKNTPAKNDWTGTTWKAFLKWRCNSSVHSCCIDTDWGVGILSKKRLIGQSIKDVNCFFEFNDLVNNRSEYLNLISFDRLKELLEQEKTT